MEQQARRITFVEERTAQQFHVAELSGRELIGNKRILHIGNCRAQPAWNIHIELINFIMVVCLGFFLHYWICHAHLLFTSVPPTRQYSLVESMLYIVRDITNLSIFAACATAFVLAMRWQQNEDAMLEADAVRAEAELKNLRSQINPHFLLNTLNNIYALTAFDQKRAQEAIQQLSKMLRHMLYDNQEEKVSVKQVVRVVEAVL